MNTTLDKLKPNAILGKINNFIKNEFTHVDFNQDYSCFVYSYNNEFSIWDMQTLQVRFMRMFKKSIGKVTVLYKTNIVLITGTTDVNADPLLNPNSLYVWDDNNPGFIAEICFREPILNMKILREYVLIVLQDSVSLYEFNNLSKEMEVFETYPNSRGICAVTDNKINNIQPTSIMAFLGKNIGEVFILNIHTIGSVPTTTVTTIKAHQTEIVCIALSRDGGLISTASEKGTLIRVFNAMTGDLVYEFRRGTLMATVNNLVFNHDATLLCATSEKGTIHIYKLTPDNQNKYYLKTIGFSGLDYSDYRIYLPDHDAKFMVAFDGVTNDLVVVSYSGVCYKYKFMNEVLDINQPLEYQLSVTTRLTPGNHT